MGTYAVTVQWLCAFALVSLFMLGGRRMLQKRITWIYIVFGAGAMPVFLASGLLKSLELSDFWDTLGVIEPVALLIVFTVIPFAFLFLLNFCIKLLFPAKNIALPALDIALTALVGVGMPCFALVILFVTSGSGC